MSTAFGFSLFYFLIYFHKEKCGMGSFFKRENITKQKKINKYMIE